MLWRDQSDHALRNERSLCPIPPPTPKKAPHPVVNFVSNNITCSREKCSANRVHISRRPIRKADKIIRNPRCQPWFQGGVSFLSHIYLDFSSSSPVPGFCPPDGRLTKLFQPSLRRCHAATVTGGSGKHTDAAER